MNPLNSPIRQFCMKMAVQQQKPRQRTLILSCKRKEYNLPDQTITPSLSVKMSNHHLSGDPPKIKVSTLISRIDPDKTRQKTQLDQDKSSRVFLIAKPLKVEQHMSNQSVRKFNKYRRMQHQIKSFDQLQQKIKLSSVEKQTNEGIIQDNKIQLEKTLLKQITSKCFVVFVDNKQLCGRRVQKQREIASLTKIMTCYMVSEIYFPFYQACCLIEKLNISPNLQIAKVTRKAAQLQGTTAELRSGDRLTLLDLLYGMMLPSGNDAAYTIADHLGRFLKGINVQCSPVKLFLEQMNIKAKELELKETNFANPHGLSNSKNTSTAQNIATLVHHAMKNDLFREVVKTSSYSCRIQNAQQKFREVTWESTNKLVTNIFFRRKYQLGRNDCIGVKTGVTPTAGPCFAGNFLVNHRNIIIVLFKTSGLEERFSEAIYLLENIKLKFSELS